MDMHCSDDCVCVCVCVCLVLVPAKELFLPVNRLHNKITRKGTQNVYVELKREPLETKHKNWLNKGRSAAFHYVCRKLAPNFIFTPFG